MKQEYIFTLKFKLPYNAEQMDELVNKLYEQGCDDALIGIGMPGQIALEFAREDNSAEEAVISALQQVQQIIPEAVLIEAAPDYVGLTDIAEIVSVSRQQMRKLYEQHASFPAPIHAGRTAMWSLGVVLDWLKENRDYAFSNAVHQVANVNAMLNLLHRHQRTRSTLLNSYSNTVVVKSYSVSSTFFSDNAKATYAAEVA